MIFVTGDIHREMGMEKISVKNFPEQKKLTKNDYLIICGDFGGIWYAKNRDDVFLKKYENMPFTTLWVDGNHENFDRLNEYPVSEWNVGKVHIINDSVIHLMRGQVYNIDGKSFFTFGGGLSIDAFGRLPRISWWKDEEPTFAEMEEALQNLDKANWNVDYVITHAAPESIVRNELNSVKPLLMEDCQAEKFLDEILPKLKFSKWYCGHYHMDVSMESKNIEELYNRILKIC